MFFIFSKILSFIVTPIVWIAGLLVYSVLSKNLIRKRKSLILSVILFFFFSNSFLLNEVMRAWEIPAMKYDDLDTYDAGVVLGGILFYDEDYDRLQFSRSVDRLLQAVELYERGKIKKIFFVGGSGSITYKDHKEAPLVKKYLLLLGIPEQDILIESESKNTHENAKFSKAILEKEQLHGKFLLITSGFHMRRSIACFKKEGVEVVAYSTDRYSGKRKFPLDGLFIPDTETISSWNVLLHELLGFVTYKVMGYV